MYFVPKKCLLYFRPDSKICPYFVVFSACVLFLFALWCPWQHITTKIITHTWLDKQEAIIPYLRPKLGKPGFRLEMLANDKLCPTAHPINIDWLGFWNQSKDYVEDCRSLCLSCSLYSVCKYTDIASQQTKSTWRLKTITWRGMRRVPMSSSCGTLTYVQS